MPTHAARMGTRAWARARARLEGQPGAGSSDVVALTARCVGRSWRVPLGQGVAKGAARRGDRRQPARRRRRAPSTPGHFCRRRVGGQGQISPLDLVRPRPHDLAASLPHADPALLLPSPYPAPLLTLTLTPSSPSRRAVPPPTSVGKAAASASLGLRLCRGVDLQGLCRRLGLRRPLRALPGGARGWAGWRPTAAPRRVRMGRCGGWPTGQNAP